MNWLHRSLLSFLALILFVSVCPSLSQAVEADDVKPWWIEAHAVSGKHPAKVIVWYEKDLTDRFGFYALAEKESDGYRQFYVGPKVKISDRLTVGVAIGRETVPSELNGVRRNLYYDANWGDFSSFGTKETGPSGPWHKVTITYAVNERWGAGLMSEKDLGRGLRLEYNIPGTKMQVWGALLRDRDTGTNVLVLGVNKSF
ncbi:MAG: hypothetical protein AAB850_02365 [Patescibacteria group bacterium]